VQQRIIARASKSAAVREKNKKGVKEKKRKTKKGKFILGTRLEGKSSAAVKKGTILHRRRRHTSIQCCNHSIYLLSYLSSRNI
jgi:hypothetical protein